MADQPTEPAEEPGREVPKDLEHIAPKLDRIVEEHFERHDRETAESLIRDAFFALPEELKEMYHEVQALHAQGRYEESEQLFTQWMQHAKAYGLM